MAETAPAPPAKVPKKKSAAKAKKAGPSVGDLIVKAVSASKERSGVSLAALKKALAAGGYDVEKKNSRVKLAIKSLVTKGTLVQVKGTGASGSFKLSKKQTETKKRRAPKAKKPAAKKPKSAAAKKPAAKKSPKKAKKPAAAAAKRRRRALRSQRSQQRPRKQPRAPKKRRSQQLLRNLPRAPRRPRQPNPRRRSLKQPSLKRQLPKRNKHQSFFSSQNKKALLRATHLLHKEQNIRHLN